jgi:TatD DNase family protein
MVTDCHAHLDDPLMGGFLESLRNLQYVLPNVRNQGFRIITNSTDIRSSKRNLEIAAQHQSVVIPFVGIHPQAVTAFASSKTIGEHFNDHLDQLVHLIGKAMGIGEIGLDPKYGFDDLQLQIFQKQLGISESVPIAPICIHSRDCVAKVLELLPSFRLSKRILFHWFAGTESELARLQSRGYFVSFGPSIIFSKRIQTLAKLANPELILAETDSPLLFSSLQTKEPLSPFAVCSVLFKLAEVKGANYENMLAEIEENSNKYLQAQSSLRLNN